MSHASLPEWLRSPALPDHDPRQTKMVWGLLWALLVVSIPILMVIPAGDPAFNGVLVADGIVISLIILARRGWVRFANHAIPSVLFLLVTYINITSDGTHDVGVVAYLLVTTLAALLLGTRALIFFTLLVVAAFSAMSVAEMDGVLVNALSGSTKTIDLVVFAAICTLFAILLRVTLQYLIDNAALAAANERAMMERNAQLEASRAEIQRLNMQLEQRIVERTADLKAAMTENEQLFRISRDVNSAQNYVELVEAIAQHLDNPRCTVTLAIYDNFDKASARMLNMVAQRMGGAVEAAAVTGGTHRAAVMREWLSAERMVVIHDLDQPQFGLNPELLEQLRQTGVKSLIIAEFALKERILGFITIALPYAHHFSAHDIRVMRAASDLSAAAVERMRLYSEQVKAAERLRTADEVKSRFMANMSHELRTPLNAILNFTRFVSSGMLGAINAEQLDALNKTIISGKHLLSLINDVLDVTKIESQMLTLFVETNVDLTVEIEMAIAAGETILSEKPVTLVRDIAPDLPLMVGDRRRLRQIFLNLISNACKFTETGSVTVSARRDGDHLVLGVQDTGPGLSPEEYAVIFEPFRQSKHGLMTSGGTGLGLAIALRLVEAHQGALSVESEPGEGATFTVRLPIASPVLVAQAESLAVQP